MKYYTRGTRSRSPLQTATGEQDWGWETNETRGKGLNTVLYLSSACAHMVGSAPHCLDLITHTHTQTDAKYTLRTLDACTKNKIEPVFLAKPAHRLENRVRETLLSTQRFSFASQETIKNELEKYSIRTYIPGRRL